MDKSTLIKVTNRSSSGVGYKIPDMGIRRQFTSRETREITFEELERLSYIPGGMRMLKEYLVVKDADAIKELGISVEPEYFYSDEDIKNLLVNGTLNEFLDCLDFAPDGVIETLKKMAVELPLDNMSKRDAILRKTGFNVTKAIEIKNTKFDGESAGTDKEESSGRRAEAPKVQATGSERRAAAPKYKVTSTMN